MTVVAETTEFPGSSNLASASYDPEAENLDITFRSGETYTYFNVPVAIYRALQNASSPGKFFYANVRNRYSYEQQ